MRRAVGAWTGKHELELWPQVSLCLNHVLSSLLAEESDIKHITWKMFKELNVIPVTKLIGFHLLTYLCEQCLNP